MAAYPLGEVVGAIAVGFAEAQKLSDDYTKGLEEGNGGILDEHGSDIVVFPNAQIDTATIKLRFAIASLRTKVGQQAGDGQQEDVLPPNLEVYVRSEDLEGLPEDSISELTFSIDVSDAPGQVQ